MIEKDINNINKIGKKPILLVDIDEVGLYFGTQDKTIGNKTYKKVISRPPSIGSEVNYTGGLANADNIILDINANDNILETLGKKSVEESLVNVYMVLVDSFTDSINKSDKIKIYSGIIDNYDIEGRRVSFEIGHYTILEYKNILIDKVKTEGKRYPIFHSGDFSNYNKKEYRTDINEIQPIVFTQGRERNYYPFVKNLSPAYLLGKIDAFSYNISDYFVSKNYTKVKSLFIDNDYGMSRIVDDFEQKTLYNNTIVSINSDPTEDKHTVELDVFPSSIKAQSDNGISKTFERVSSLQKENKTYNNFSPFNGTLLSDKSTELTLDFDYEIPLEPESVKIGVLIKYDDDYYSDKINNTAYISDLFFTFNKDGLSFSKDIKKDVLYDKIKFTVANYSDEDLNFSDEHLRIYSIFKRVTYKIEELPEKIYAKCYNITNPFFYLTNVETEEDVETDEKWRDYIPRPSTFFNETQTTSDIIADICDKHCMYGFYDHNNKLKLLPVKKYEDLEFAYPLEVVNFSDYPINDKNIFTDNPNKEGDVYTQHGIKECTIRKASVSEIGNDLIFNYAYNPANDSYIGTIHPNFSNIETEYLKHTKEINSKYVTDDKDAQTLYDIKYEKLKRPPYIAEFTGFLDSMVFEIGDVINLRSYEAERMIPDYQSKKWVIIGKRLRIMEDEGLIEFKAYYME